MAKKIDPKEVELFLLDNLDFFESRESLVGELKFKHSSSKASSLLERQILKLREEHKNLIDLINSFVDNASINENLFNKSKDLTLQILESKSKKEIIKTVEKSFNNDFNVDKCLLEFYKNNEINEIEEAVGLSMHKGAIHCGSFSSEKANILFNNEKIESMVIAVIVLNKEIGLLKLGSLDRTKYLGDEDTTFIEYIRDVLEKKLAL
ncbi:MAG: hypothetical protein CMD46_05555 [Gammaproteobacteria bacterium]|nr:hypothetical protein [Gammaproteobacteria bacterium]|tara:strand:- start:1415 stop:2035 length:621 start_codon:yes stop_codon:yes gene_type:complete